MARSVAADHDRQTDCQVKTKIGLPLVSIIITNDNSGRHLVEAVNSALAQTYPNIELIIVDDLSTDDSGAVLLQIETAHPKIKIIRRTESGGQSLASRDGFAASSGDYIVFLKADDVLAPNFLLIHIFVQLSSRIPVGVTSSNMTVQAEGARSIGTLDNLSDYVRRHKTRAAGLIRRVDDNGDALWPLPAPDVEIGDRLYFIPPGDMKSAPWPPMSGNCFRRDAISLFLNNDNLARLRSHIDVYLVRAISSFTGTLLIDCPLGSCRAPDANAITDGVGRSSANAAEKARQLAIDHLISNAEIFARKVHGPSSYLKALRAISSAPPVIPSKVRGCYSYAGGEIVTHFGQVRNAVGILPLVVFSLPLGIPPWSFAWAWIRSIRRPSSPGHAQSVGADQKLFWQVGNVSPAQTAASTIDASFARARIGPKRAAVAGSTSLPLVSIIIVNYNYGCFLLETIESAIAQTYPNIEFIVVDDASRDESPRVLDAVAATYPEIKILRLQVNGGQSRASQHGFEICTGDYVVFLDADDVLLPDFVRTHIFAHLSLRGTVGLSSSDMAQAVGNRLVLGKTEYFGDRAWSQKGRSNRGPVPPVDESTAELGTLSRGADLLERLHFIPPRYRGRWVWAPTSGNCFRRDALAPFFKNDALSELRSCTDAYLVRGVALTSGSILIDRPLGIYRLHGANVFARMASLNGFLQYDRGAPSDNDQKGRRMVIDQLIAHADLFCRQLRSPFAYLGTLSALNGTWPRLPSRIAGCRSYLGGEVILNFRSLSEAVGRLRLIVWANLLGIAPWLLFDAWLKSLRRPKATRSI